MPEPFWKDNERAAFELLYVEEARIESVLVMRDHEEDRVTLRPIPEIDGHADEWTAHCFLSQVGVENASRRIDRDDGSGFLSRESVK